MFSIGSCVWKLVSQLVTLFLEAVEPLRAWDLWRKQVTGVRVSWEMKTYSPAVFPDSPKCKCSVSHSWRQSPPCLSHHSWLCLQTVNQNKPFLPINLEVFFVRYLRPEKKKKRRRRMQLNSFPSPSDQKFYKGVVTGRFLMTWSLVSSKRSGI